MSRPLQIMIVDDSDDDRLFARVFLNRVVPDAVLHEFSYAEHALDFIKSPDRPPIDLILLDISMPRMDGFEFIDKFVTLYPEHKGPARVVVMSHSIDPKDYDWAEKHEGLVGFLTKPITQNSMSSIIDQLVLDAP